MYHHIDDTLAPGREVVGMENFESHLQFLKENGYTTVTISELGEFMNSKRILPQKTIALTFDDGWKTNLVAEMILNLYHYKGTFYIISRRNGLDTKKPYLSDDDLRSLSKNSNVEIGAHTQSHFMKWIKDLDKLDQLTMNQEIKGSKMDLEQIIGKKVTSFSWPFGYSRLEALQYAKSVGYTSSVLVYVPGQLNKVGDSSLTISRINIDGRCSLDIFKKMIETGKEIRCK
jgi:peptidoglycan/xylan/chitin deacetylase (PgdA/CDA1 family)